MSVLAEHLAERGVDEVRARVRLGRAAAPVGVDDRRGGVAHAHLARPHLHAVADEALHGLLHVEHLEIEALADDAARVGLLAAGLRVEARLGEDDLRDVARHRVVDAASADDEPEDRRPRLQLVVAREAGLARRAELAVDGEVGQRRLLALGVGLGARALLQHQAVEGLAVDREAVLLGHLEREVDGEAEGVVQEERGVARDPLAALRLRLADRDVEDRRAAGERAEEGLLLRVRQTRDAVEVVRHLGVGGLHRVARRGEQLAEGRGVHAHEAHRAHGASHQAPQDVAAPLVRRSHAVRHQHEGGAHVVGDDAHGHVVLVVGAVTTSGELGRAVEHRADLVDLVHVLDALLEERDALEAHAGVDVLLGEVAEDLEVALARAGPAQVLHEDQVPDLHVAVVVGGRAAVGAVGGTAVEEDLRAGARGAGLAGVPVVRVAAEALDPLVRQARDALPRLPRLVVLVVHGDPEVVGREAEAAVGLARREQLPRVRDGLLLEVVAEREVAVHLEEGAVSGRAADLLDVEGADALLDARRARERRGHDAREVGHERHHAGHREQQGRVVAHERRGRHDGVPPVAEVRQPGVADVCGLHAVYCFPSSVMVSSASPTAERSSASRRR